MNDDTHLDPASTVIDKVGGAAVAAEICGVYITTVYRWRYRREDGGTGGIIPAEHQAALMRWSLDHGGKLKPQDFFPDHLVASPKRKPAKAQRIA